MFSLAALAGIALALVAVLGLAFGAGPLAAYAQATSAQLFARQTYIDAVLGAQPAPPAWTPRVGMDKP